MGGMSENLARAQHYREQADHLRVLAGKDDNLKTREALLVVARDYDRLSSKYMKLARQDAPKTS